MSAPTAPRSNRRPITINMVPKTDPAAEYQDRTTGEQVLPLTDEYLINVITRGYARAAYPRSPKIARYPRTWSKENKILCHLQIPYFSHLKQRNMLSSLSYYRLLPSKRSGKLSAGTGMAHEYFINVGIKATKINRRTASQSSDTSRYVHTFVSVYSFTKLN